MGELPDEVWGFFQEYWELLGYTPIILYRLMEHGWSYEELDMVLTKVIGPDYNNIKTTEWITRLEKQGVKIPKDSEDISFVEFMDRIIFTVTLEESGIWKK
jgi:hypothetical protein